MEVNIEIKPADRSNFTEFSMDMFDRFQEVRNVYRIENGILVLKNHPFTETWSPERKREKASANVLFPTARTAANRAARFAKPWRTERFQRKDGRRSAGWRMKTNGARSERTRR